MISVLILTKNEQQDLPGCLASVAWSDDVHVLDSKSTDNTVAIAEEVGARVTSRVFDDWSTHQNWALQNLPFKYPWVLYLDADERVLPELRDSVQRAVKAPGAVVAFQVMRRDFYEGKWLRHVQPSPCFLRLFRPEAMRYRRLVNPVSVPDGPTGEVSGYLDHFPFSKGLGHWFERHNEYSRLEALQTLMDRQTSAQVRFFGWMFERNLYQRRAMMKEVFYRMPCRPTIKFLYGYLFKMGFLDGRAGFRYARLQAIYEYMIVLKTRELEGSLKS